MTKEEKIAEVMGLAMVYGKLMHELGLDDEECSWGLMAIESKLRELLQPSESGEVENIYSVLYTLYSVAYTYSDNNVSDKGKDAMMKASKLLDDYYSKKGQE